MSFTSQYDSDACSGTDITNHTARNELVNSLFCLRSGRMWRRALDDWWPTFRDTGHSTLEDNTMSRNVRLLSSTDATSYPIRMETSTAPVRKPCRLAIYFVERCISC